MENTSIAHLLHITLSDYASVEDYRNWTDNIIQQNEVDVKKQ